MIDLSVMVIRAAARDDARLAREALFMLSGGPGTGSTTMAPMAHGWARPGASHPLPCPSPAETDPAAIFGHWHDVKGLQACRALLEQDRAIMSQEA